MAVDAELMGWGRVILPGCRRALSAMWRFVVRVSQIGVSPSSSSERRFFFVDWESFERAAFWIWARRAFEALRV